MTTIKQGNKIFIGGIANDIIESDMIRYFEKFSTIDDCVIMIDKVTNHSRGFGFITVEDSSKVDLILRTQPHIIKGKKVECKLAIPREVILTQAEQSNEDCPKKKPSADYAFYLRKLFVGGLPLYVNENDMLNYFQRFGEVERCIIKRDEETGRSRGFGFVIFEGKDSIDVILSFGQNHFILGKWIECKRAQPKEIPYINPSKEAFHSIGMTMPSNSPNVYFNNNGFIQPYMVQSQGNNPTQMQQLNDNRPMYPSFTINPNDCLNSMAATPNKWSESMYSNNKGLFQIMPSKKRDSGDMRLEKKIRKMNLNKTEDNKEEKTETNSQLVQNYKSDNCSHDRLVPYHSNDHLNSSKIDNSFEFMEHNSDANNHKQRSHLGIEQPHQLNNNNNYGNTNSNFPTNQSRDIDSFTNYFNNCLQNPYWNSYFHYKLFDKSGEDVSKLAYKNSDKIKLFVDDKQNEEDPTKEQSQSQSQSHQYQNSSKMGEFNSSRNESWKHTRNFQLKKDNNNSENSTGLYKPY